MHAPGSQAPGARAASRMYYGWAVLAVAAAAMVGTLPGRTQGLGLVTEPILADLAIGRVAYAQVNLWATLIGALFALGIGRAIDQAGSRVALAGVTVSLGLVVCLMSQTRSLAAFAILLTLTRGLGQSALSVVSLAMVGQWFVRRIDMAMAIYTVTMSVGFMMAFPAVGGLVQAWGWRAAWWTIGCTLIIGLAPIGWLVVRRNPEACGLRPDGDVIDAGPAGTSASDGAADDRSGHHWRYAIRTPAFWVFAAGASLYGLIASGIGLFNEAILAERGFDARMYYNTLVVTALTALAGNFAGGWLSRRVRLTSLLVASMLILAAGLLALPHVRTVSHVMIWATAMGVGGGFITVLFFTVWPRAFGRLHLGRIQGIAQAMTVVASAVGPLLLAWCVERTGTYAAAFYVLAAPVALAGLVASMVTLPPPPAAPSS